MTSEEIQQLQALIKDWPVKEHYHEGIQSNKIYSADLYPYPIVSAVPNDGAVNGTIRLYISGTTYILYIRLNNTWQAFRPTISGLAGTKIYYVSDTSGGAVNRKLTFTNGILTAET